MRISASGPAPVTRPVIDPPSTATRSRSPWLPLLRPTASTVSRIISPTGSANDTCYPEVFMPGSVESNRRAHQWSEPAESDGHHDTHHRHRPRRPSNCSAKTAW